MGREARRSLGPNRRIISSAECSFAFPTDELDSRNFASKLRDIPSTVSSLFFGGRPLSLSFLEALFSLLRSCSDGGDDKSGRNRLQRMNWRVVRWPARARRAKSNNEMRFFFPDKMCNPIIHGPARRRRRPPRTTTVDDEPR